MALPNVSGAIIATGFNCQVKVGTNATDAKVTGFVTSFNATEDFQAQDANVIGVLGPVSIDPQGYNCSITLASFIPAKLGVGATQYEDGGEVSLTDKLPKRADFITNGAVQKWEYLSFYNKKDASILAEFSGVIVTSNGISVDGSQYVRGNVQLRALAKL